MGELKHPSFISLNGLPSAQVLSCDLRGIAMVVTFDTDHKSLCSVPRYLQSLNKLL